jgi:hypothetical protein
MKIRDYFHFFKIVFLYSKVLREAFQDYHNFDDLGSWEILYRGKRF